VQDLGLRVTSSGFKVESFEYRVYVLELRVYGQGFGDFKFRVQGYKFWI
jgi:hypothetical protein